MGILGRTRGGPCVVDAKRPVAKTLPLGRPVPPGVTCEGSSEGHIDRHTDRLVSVLCVRVV